VLDGRQSVSRDDLRLAVFVMVKSDESRAVCVAALANLERQRARTQGQADAERADAQAIHQRAQDIDRIAALIGQDVTATPDGITEGELNRRLASRDRPFLAEAIGRAMDAGQIERSGAEVFPCF